VLYLLAGGAVAVAFYVTTAAGSRSERLFQFGAALVFWPLYLTLLLTRAAPRDGTRPAVCDPSSAELQHALAEVESALQSLDDWEDGVLAHDKSRLDELHAAVARIAAVIASRSASPQKDERVQPQGWPGSRGNFR
jgi:hypothetical protein